MKTPILVIAALALLNGLPASAQQVKTPANLAVEPIADTDFVKRHEACLERIAKDTELAYEEAMIWQSQGGGRRARHCVAMALFALGQADEAAFKLEKLARSPDAGTPAMRAGYFSEAADMWLSAGLPSQAYSAINAGLDISENHIGLQVTLSRTHAAMERWDDAERVLNKVVTLEPQNVTALRYRADTRRRLGKLSLAKADIDRAVNIDITNIDTLLVRGEINEAIRLAAKPTAQEIVQ